MRATVRNFGQAVLPAGVVVGFYVEDPVGDRLLGTATTTSALFPGQVEEVSFVVNLATHGVTLNDLFYAAIVIDPQNRTFRECREDNNESERLEPAPLLYQLTEQTCDLGAARGA